MSSSAGSVVGVPRTGRGILEQRGRALTSPTESGCPPGFVFLGGACVPGTTQFQPGTMRAVVGKKLATRASVVGNTHGANRGYSRG